MNRNKIIGGFASMVVLLSGLVYFLLYTATGLSWYINYAISDLPGKIALKSVHHTLEGHCEITGFHYQSEKVALKFSRVILKWNPLAIFRDQLNIQHIVANDLQLQFFHSDSESLPISLHQSSFPLVANIEHGSLENVTIHTGANNIYRIKSVNFNQLYFDETFYVDKMIAQDRIGNTLEVSGEAGLRSSDIINLTTQASIHIRGTSLNVRSHGTVVGSITQLRFLQRFTAPYNIKVEGRVKTILSDPYWHFEAIVNDSMSIVFPDNWHIQSMQGKLKGEGSSSQLKISGHLDIADAMNNRWDTSISTQWNAPGAKFSVAARLPASPNVGLTIKGEWTYQKNTDFIRTLLVEGQWNNFWWSTNKNSRISSAKGRINFDGKVYRTKIAAKNVTIESTGTHLKTLSITANPDEKRNIAIKGNARTNNGKLLFSGLLKKSHTGYQFKTISFNGEHFDLVRKPKAHIIVTPDITLSSKNQTLYSTGNIEIPKANIQLQDLQTTYRQLAALLTGNTNFAVNGQKRVIDKINVRLGDGVWMHGFGLNAQVTGELALVNLFNNSMLADGELNVLHGNYKRDNRHYSVTGGKITFHRQSLDNPEVAINIAGGNLPDNNSDTVKGLLQNLYKEQNADKLALNP